MDNTLFISSRKYGAHVGVTHENDSAAKSSLCWCRKTSSEAVKAFVELATASSNSQILFPFTENGDAVS